MSHQSGRSRLAANLESREDNLINKSFQIPIFISGHDAGRNVFRAAIAMYKPKLQVTSQLEVVSVKFEI